MKKLSLLLFGGYLILSQMSIVQASSRLQFSDLPKENPYYSDVMYLIPRGIINGYPDGSYKPESTINRAEAIKMIFSTRNLPIDENAPQSFSDIPKKAWYTPFIASAKSLGIVNGFPDGTYRPEEPVNRAEFLKIALLSQQIYEGIETSTTDTSLFSDIDPDMWYYPYFSFSHNNGLIPQTLLKQNKFVANADISRAEAASIVSQMMRYNESSGFYSYPIDESLVNTSSTPEIVKIGDQTKTYDHTTTNGVFPFQANVDIGTFYDNKGFFLYKRGNNFDPYEVYVYDLEKNFEYIQSIPIVFERFVYQREITDDFRIGNHLYLTGSYTYPIYGDTLDEKTKEQLMYEGDASYSYRDHIIESTKEYFVVDLNLSTLEYKIHNNLSLRNQLSSFSRTCCYEYIHDLHTGPHFYDFLIHYKGEAKEGSLSEKILYRLEKNTFSEEQLILIEDENMYFKWFDEDEDTVYVALQKNKPFDYGETTPGNIYAVQAPVALPEITLYTIDKQSFSVTNSVRLPDVEEFNRIADMKVLDNTIHFLIRKENTDKPQWHTTIGLVTYDLSGKLIAKSTQIKDYESSITANYEILPYTSGNDIFIVEYENQSYLRVNTQDFNVEELNTGLYSRRIVLHGKMAFIYTYGTPSEPVIDVYPLNLDTFTLGPKTFLETVHFISKMQLNDDGVYIIQKHNSTTDARIYKQLLPSDTQTSLHWLFENDGQ